MARLTKYSLAYSDKSKKWELRDESTKRTVKSFSNKAAALKGGALAKAVGGMGSVKIKKRNGKIQEERTYPRGTDPRRFKG
jgi:hypothetical protein